MVTSTIQTAGTWLLSAGAGCRTPLSSWQQPLLTSLRSAAAAK